MELLLDTKLFVKGETVAVALSGGRDSVSLLHALFCARERLGISLVAIHVEHGIRGEESRGDAEFSEKLCSRLGVPLKVVTVDVPGNLEKFGSVEQTARALRYGVFDSALESGFCDKIATAHHRGDNAETVLMRVFRGTGISGLGGIRPSRGRYIRPLLGVTREEIDRYVLDNGLSYREDGTNGSAEYTRNFIRHEIIPKARERFPQVEDSLERLASLSLEADGFLRRQASRLVSIEDSVAYISEDSEPLLVKYAVKLACEGLGIYHDIEERHLASAVSAMQGGRKCYSFPFNLRLEREEGGLTLSPEPEPVGSCEAKLGQNCVGERRIVIEEVESLIPGKLCFSAKLDGLVLRGREEGDSFHRFGGGRKSLGDYFTDVKLPSRIRDRAIVLARGKEILAVVGVEISEQVRVKSPKDKIYTIREEENYA